MTNLFVSSLAHVENQNSAFSSPCSLWCGILVIMCWR